MEPSQSPSHPNASGAIGYDEADGYTLLVTSEVVGVTTSAGFTWKWTGHAWQQIGPAPTAQSNLVYDPVVSKVVMLASGCLGCPPETWAWDGSSWLRLYSAPSPGLAGLQGQVAGMLVFDDARRNLVFYDPAARTTFVFDGQNWTHAGLSLSPPYRSTTSLIYDPQTRTVLLYGGVCGSMTFDCQLNDTWEWDGTSWKQQHPTASPDPGGFVQLAYDEQVGRIVLVQEHLPGGLHPSADDIQVSAWTWDGASWTQISGPASQSLRLLGMAYDRTHQQLLLVGGAGFETTWSYANSKWGQPEFEHGG